MDSSKISAEWVSAIAESISALGIILVLWQIRLTYSQLRADHFRSRRELAINLYKEWISLFQTLDPLLINIGFLLDDKQLKAVFEKESFLAKPDQMEDLSLFAGVTIPSGSKSFTIDKALSTKIRFQIVCYMNMLECVLSAYRHNVAEKKILFEQFASFYDKSTKKAIFSDFRAAAGGESAYPSIAAFELELRALYDKVPAGQGPTG